MVESLARSSNTACAQWYVLTVPELTHHGKHLFANAAERKEKYSELPRFAKDHILRRGKKMHR